MRKFNVNTVAPVWFYVVCVTVHTVYCLTLDRPVNIWEAIAWILLLAIGTLSVVDFIKALRKKR